MYPEIKVFPGAQLVGMHASMSVANMQPAQLWSAFRPRLGEINHRVGAEFYDVVVYPDADYFQRFNPTREFVKWACVAVSSSEPLPDGMEVLKVPAGEYAVFSFTGPASKVGQAYQQIYGTWLPQSGYRIDLRPHFSIMPPNYRPADPEATETLWVPIKQP